MSKRERVSPCPELDEWLAEGGPGRRERLYRVLHEQYDQIKIPREVRKAAKGLMNGVLLAMWWVTPNDWMWPAEGKANSTVTPEMLWEMGQHDDVLDFILTLKLDLDFA